MGRKIFISYKYGDKQVRHLSSLPSWEATTGRDYVDMLQKYLEKTDDINKGEKDNEDMSSLADSTIASKLGDKIVDSSVTIVLISKGMKEQNRAEEDQWIPWEISYSLRNQSRNGGNSKTNAMLAVALPDRDNSYDYLITNNTCCKQSCRSLNTQSMFEILRNNMFNQRDKSPIPCIKGDNVYSGDSSYITVVKWDDFIDNPQKYISKAVDIKEHANDYDIQKRISK